jgi:hypothetical protein
MSDRETILQTLRQIKARLRTNRLFGGLASVFAGFAFIGLLVKIWDLVSPFSSSTIRGFWVLWFLALVVVIGRAIREKVTLTQAAAELDQKARLKNEIASAYWFLGHGPSNPWTELQIRRAAQTAGKLDLKGLYPRVVPPTSFLAVGLLVLLLILNFTPLPFDYNFLYSREAPSLTLSTEDEALLEEIEELLAQAENLQQDEVVEQLQELIESLRSGELSATEAIEELSDIQNAMDEGNLNVSSIIEGLEEIGRDLQQSDETLGAGEALASRDLDQAARELRGLAEEISDGQMPADDLAETLQEASENTRPGLEELADQFQQASEGLRNEDQEATENALEEAAQQLEELSDMVESQQIKNQTSEQLELLEDTLRQQQIEEQAQMDEQQQQEQQEGQEGASEGQGQGQEQTGMEGAPQQGDMDAPPEYAPGAEGEGQMSPQATPPAPQDMQGLNASGAGQMPSGFGFSPDEKEGAPTSLNVQLQEERIEALEGEGPENEEEETIEETSREQRSKLDYRNVRSELTPAQQGLLNQEQIPRPYRNLIKNYFQAIRPPGNQ